MYDEASTVRVASHARAGRALSQTGSATETRRHAKDEVVRSAHRALDCHVGDPPTRPWVSRLCSRGDDINASAAMPRMKRTSPDPRLRMRGGEDGGTCFGKHVDGDARHDV